MGIIDWIFGRRPRPVPPGPAPTPGNPFELYVSVNRARIAAGLHPLATDPRLEAVAARRIARLAARGVLDHAGFAAEIEATVPGDFTRMGAGVTTGRGGMLYWCVDFAKVQS